MVRLLEELLSGRIEHESNRVVVLVGVKHISVRSHVRTPQQKYDGDHTHTHTHTHTQYIRTFIYTHKKKHTHTQYIRTFIHTHTHTHMKQGSPVIGPVMAACRSSHHCWKSTGDVLKV